MKNFQAFLIFFALFTSCATHVEAKRCSDKSSQASLCYTTFDQIHPTQFVLGKLSIISKTSKIEKMDAKGKIEQYLKKKSAPAIIGPDGLYYIIDRHHTSYSILNSKIQNRYKKLYLKVIQNWSNLSYSEFAKKMVAYKYVWLRDENHIVRKFSELPKHINNLEDDPYRSLAWLVRENGGFEKKDFSFQEFYWAMFFKTQGIKLSSSDEQAVKAVLKQAVRLAKSSKASHLPGFKGKK
jgi:hypothetical protein